MSDLVRMQELVKVLNDASRSYYQENKELMSNFDYDRLYDELLELEKSLKTVLADSPTQKVGYEILSQLPKEAHESAMLSLDKTKDRQELKAWLKDQKGLLSYKLDGLTIVLTYRDGRLFKAVTRGNGFIGEVITNNAKMFKNIPVRIAYEGELVLRGEAVIRYSDFEAINQELDEEHRYKNPRNLCSGSVRQLNNEITAKRGVRFYGFTLVHSDKGDVFLQKSEELQWLESLGFECVTYRLVDASSLEEKIDELEGKISENDIGSDGLVLTFDNKAYSRSLGQTSKFPKDSIAFKWKDEIKETTLREVFWSASRTGLINPVAIFDSVELEGTSVSRASLHNISIIEKLELGIGDKIEVYKANMIIPQIAENQTRSGELTIPKSCPVCGEETIIKEVNDVKVLYCSNDTCAAKKIKAFAHFAGRNAMDIEGLSEATLLKLVQLGLIHEFGDLYTIGEEDKKERIVEIEGFGEKSFQNLVEAIEKSKKTKLPNFIYALGILHVGLSNAKLLCKAYNNDLEKIMQASPEELVEVEGFGEVIAHSLHEYFQKEKNRDSLKHLLKYIEFDFEEDQNLNQVLDGKTFVITGSLEVFENRDALKAEIEKYGGKVTGSVSSKTDYLINNDVDSTSSKNKKAKSLNIPIINESQFGSLIE